jgi:hemerythrin-like domain-containing protein
MTDLRDRPAQGGRSGITPLSYARPDGDDPLQALLKFHREIRHSLNLLDELARAPGYGEEERQVAYSLWEFFSGPMAWHDQDEDLSVLGRLKRAKLAAMFEALLDDSLQTHARMKLQLETLRPHLERLIRGERCEAADFIGAAVDLRGLIEPHLAVEEREIYPFARYFFDEQTRAAIAREVEQRKRERGEDSLPPSR